MPDALFETLDANSLLFQPSELTRGPWSPDAQHGGAPSALMATVLEAFDTPEAPRRFELPDGTQESMFLARLTVELLKPVPLTPLRVVPRTERRGRKVQLVGASLLAGESEVARATALRIRPKVLPVPLAARPSPTTPPPPLLPETSDASVLPWGEANANRAFHNKAVEHRCVSGSLAKAGPVSDWIRLNQEVIAGQTIAPVARVAAAADFGNGVSWTLPRADNWMFINPDLTIYLHRYPSSPWVCLEAETWPQDHGVGLAESRLWDEAGVLGRSLQSLMLDRAPA